MMFKLVFQGTYLCCYSEQCS